MSASLAVPIVHDPPRRRASVVFVNFHSEALIRPRALSLVEAGFSVIVADNSDTFGSLAQVSVVRSGSNVGFAAGCNLGAAQIGRDIDTICFHNPDVDISIAALNQLIHGLDRQTRPGLLAPAEGVGRVVRTNGYHYPGPVRECMLIAQRVVRSHWRPRRHLSGRKGRSEYRDRRGGGRRFGSAALLIADRAAFHDIGGFDNRFFMYGEDLDLWHRFAMAGRQCEFVPELTARHAFAQGSPLSAGRREIYRWLGIELFVALNHEGWWPAFRAVHRAWLPVFAQAHPSICRLVGTLWRRGLGPEAVAKEIFFHLATA